MTMIDRMRRRLAASPVVAKVGKRLVPRTDVRLHRMTNGRFSLAAMGGVQILLLTTTGRRSGQDRVTPVTYVRVGDALHVVGSNWGGPRHPGWALNLLANPEATIEIGGERSAVTAQRLSGPDRAAAWSRLVEVWPPYADYAVKAGDRELPVFRLRPAEAG